MIRVYLTTQFIKDNKYTTQVGEEASALNIDPITNYVDKNSNNVMAICEGANADQLSDFMLPPHSTDTLISSLPEQEVIDVISELTNRGIDTNGSITCGDLLENICLFFDADFTGIGSLLEKDFS